MTSNQDAAKQLDIRKYPNRRYYDVTRSQHLTLEDIRALVQEGYSVRVTDSKTDTDISAKVLAQIILELDSDKIDAFPASLLMRLIRVNDRLIKDFMERYYEQALTMFMQYRQQFEDQMRGGDGLAAFYSSLANWNRTMMNPFGMPLMGGFGLAPSAGTDGNENGNGNGNGTGEARDSENLRERIHSLEKQLGLLEAKLAEGNRRSPSKRRQAKV